MPLEAIVLTQEFLSPTTPLQVQCVAVWNIIAATHKINQNYIYIKQMLKCVLLNAKTKGSCRRLIE
jgi:hypothetical protein